jgi:hypothetical protein
MNKTRLDYPTEKVPFQKQIITVDPDNHFFIWRDNFSSFAFFLSKNGKVTPLDFKDAKVFFSPDLKYWTVISNQEIKIFFPDNTLLKSVPFTSTAEIQEFDVNWRPDDSGFFLCVERDLYSIDISSGSIELVETNVNDTYGQKFMWINEK